MIFLLLILIILSSPPLHRTTKTKLAPDGQPVCSLLRKLDAQGLFPGLHKKNLKLQKAMDHQKGEASTEGRPVV